MYSSYALEHPDEFQVVAVAEPDKTRREEFAKRHNIKEEFQFSSYEELLKKRKAGRLRKWCAHRTKMHYEPVVEALKKGVSCTL